MLTTSIFPGRYVQGYDAIQSLGKEAKRFGEQALLLLDPFVADELFPTFEANLKSELKFHTERFTGEAADEANRLVREPHREGFEIPDIEKV